MQIEEIEGKDAITAVENGSIFIDVREPYEIDEISYDIDQLNIPLGSIKERMSEIPQDKDVIIGCRSGARSMNACLFLASNGYTKVKNLQGGIIEWAENDYPTK